MVPAMSRLVAHGTCRRVKACNNFRTASPTGQTVGTTDLKLAGHTQVALT